MGKDAYKEYLKKHNKEFANDMENLQEIYNRGGFTQGYLEGLSGVPYEKNKSKFGWSVEKKK